MRSVIAGAFAALCLAAGPTVAQPAPNDLRDFRVGMPVSALPAEGYAELLCAGRGRNQLASWSQFRDCTPDAAGLHQVAFRYADNAEHDTTVAGQPVLLSLGIADDGLVHSLLIRSDPVGRVFNRKRGAHLGDRAMAQYGTKGWTCKTIDPASGQVPIGNTFVHDRCEKTLGDRQLVVERALFRDVGQPQDKFISTSSLTITWIPSDAK